jgi:hypothetical protein
MQSPVQEWRRNDSNVNDIRTRLGEAANERVAKRFTARAVVAPDGDRTQSLVFGKVRRVCASNRACYLGR